MNAASSPPAKVPDWITEHLRVYAESPAKGHLWDATAAGGRADTPTLLLTTTGRKSGRQITMPLIYGRDGDRFLVIGSKGGAPNHPAWYLNLQTDPHAQIQVVEQHYRVVAHTVEGAERDRLWRLMAEIYPPYNSYQERAERVIPVIALEPQQ